MGIDAFLEVFERAQVPRLHVLWILERDDVFPGEFVIAHQIPPHSSLNIEPLHGVIGKDVARVLERNNMGIVGEDLVCDWIHRFSLFVF